MRPGECPSPWRNPQILLTLLLVFLCGAAAGALSMRYNFRAAAAPAATWKEGNREIALKHFVKELDLTAGQEKEVALVLDDFSMYYQTLQAQMDEVRANGKERIVSILGPEQREKFKRMMHDLQQKQLR
jgi:Spy/CpxP family protein refolding chaperone